MALHPSYPICPKSFVSRKFARVGCRWRDDWFFSSSLRFTLHFSGTHARSSIVCVSFASWKMIIQGEEFSERRSMQRSYVTFFNIYFYFYSCKIDYTLSENETNSSLKIWPKISFHKDNQSWGNKNSHPLVYGTRCTDVIDNRRHGRDMEGRFVRCNPPILLRCHASSGTRSIHPAAKLEGAKLPPVNLAA